jgi:hypothetical protein
MSTNSEEETLLEKYYTEIKQQVDVNEFNMKEVQMKLPVARHYWVARLMHHKKEANKLKSLRKQAKERLHEKMTTEAPTQLTVKAIDIAVENHSIIRNIDEKITENEIIIEFLTKTESNFRSISYDISNLIKIIELETT